jgi:hypothetical protein
MGFILHTPFLIFYVDLFLALFDDDGGDGDYSDHGYYHNDYYGIHIQYSFQIFESCLIHLMPLLYRAIV